MARMAEQGRSQQTNKLLISKIAWTRMPTGRQTALAPRTYVKAVIWIVDQDYCC